MVRESLITADFYKRVQALGPQPQVEQWGSLITCSQYRDAYARTLSYVKKSSLCLDWGAGNGHYSFFLTQSGYPTHAYAFDDPPAFVRSQPSYQFTKGSAQDPFSIPFADGFYDAVFSMGVLEHVHESGGDQKASMKEVERILKPGGLFLVFHLPNKFSWIEFLVRILNRLRGHSRHEHSRLFTYQEVAILLKDTHLQVLEYGRYNMIPRNSFNRLPKLLTNNRVACVAIDLLDDVLASLMPLFAQNWFFILRKER